jgi:hypothetical protein
MLERPLDIAADAADVPLDIDVTDSVALRRLVEEIRADPTQVIGATAYNRTYHRHNR